MKFSQLVKMNLIGFFLVGCMQTATPSFGTLPPYIHYAAPASSDIHLEFDYLNSWVLNEELQDENFKYIDLVDSQSVPAPTRAPNEPHGTPSDVSRIRILIRPVTPDQTLENIIKSHEKGYRGTTGITKLNSYAVKIDGYDASVFEYQVDLPDAYASPTFERNIFFADNDQIYLITFSIAEFNRENEFEKEYEHFFESLKVVQ